jgi:hypothetical protein
MKMPRDCRIRVVCAGNWSHEPSHECDDVACEAFSSRVAEGVAYFGFYSGIEAEEFIEEDRDIVDSNNEKGE